MTISRTARLSSYLMCLLFIALACTNKNPTNDFQSQMRDAYRNTAELFRYVWSPQAFSAPENHKRINSLLAELASDFHRVEQIVPIEKFEPGFRVSLITQQEMLSDIKERFNRGDKDYANWALRGITANCISCHSRYEAPVDFIGKTPPIEGDSFEARFAAAEFLFASRQFEVASNNLIRLASDSLSTDQSGNDAIRALKLWLLIRTRVKSDSSYAADTIQSFSTEHALPQDLQDMLQNWETALRALEQEDHIEFSTQAARKLLRPVLNDTTLANDELNLVNTLRATTILHHLLESDIPRNTRRQATFLLALAYQHTPITSLEIFREFYLEQCIREFPYTEEAQLAYKLYSDYLETISTGSGGLHLEQEDHKKLQTLRKLAYGTEGITIKDTAPVY